MTTIAEAYVQLKPSMRGFSAQMNNELGPEMDRAGASGGKRFGGAFLPMLGGMAVAGAAALVGLGVAGVSAGVQTAASMEQAKIAFTTMLGSGQKAQTFLDQLAKFAAETPFEFPELQTAASSLISAGVSADKVIPIMTTLGNVTSGMGTGSEGVKRATVALQQMQAAGKITGEDLNQLRDAGIPVYDLLAAATGKSKEQVVALAQAGKLGKKELDAMMGALESGKGLERFNGLMEAQSQSLSGLWSTFGDNLNMGLAKAVEPLIPMLKDGLGATAQWLGDTAMPALANGLKWAVDSFKSFSASGEVGAAKVFLGQVGAFIRDELVPALRSIGDWIMKNIAPSVMELGAAFQRAYQVVAPIVTQLVSGIMDKLGPMMPTIIGIFQGVGTAVASIISVIASVVRIVFGGIQTFWAQWGTTITAYLSNTIGVIVNVFAVGIDFVSGLWKAVASLLKGDWRGALEDIRESTTKMWEHLKAAFNDGVAAIGAVVGGIATKMGEFFSGIISAAKTAGTNIAQGIADGISGGIQWVLDAAQRLAEGALDQVKTFLGIKSPSQVMRDQVGFQMAAGVGVGIGRGSGLVDAAMNDLVSRTLAPIAINASGTITGGGGSGGFGDFPQNLVLMIGGAEFNAYLTTRDRANDFAGSNMLRAGRGA